MKPSFDHINKFRERNGPLGSSDDIGRAGAFLVPHPNNLVVFSIIATDGSLEPKWEHVSVKAKNKGSPKWRCPTWEEMCFIKGLFWGEDEVVMQLHVAGKDYINLHPAVLHLWKPVDSEIPLPPIEYV